MFSDIFLTKQALNPLVYVFVSQPSVIHLINSHYRQTLSLAPIVPSVTPTSFSILFPDIFMTKSCIKSNGSCFRTSTLRNRPCKFNICLVHGNPIVHIINLKTFYRYFLDKIMLQVCWFMFSQASPQRDTSSQFTTPCYTITDPLALCSSLIISKTFSRYFFVKNQALNPLVHIFASQPSTIHHVIAHSCIKLILTIWHPFIIPKTFQILL